MDTKSFVRKPFVVQAIQITAENIEELAPEIGTLKKKDNGTPFIIVDRNKVPNIFRVFPGYWMTRMNGNVRCYSKRIFAEQFVDPTDDMLQWVEYMNTIGNEVSTAPKDEIVDSAIPVELAESVESE